MSRKKQTYSMTARERKELRRAEEEKRNKKSKERETALADANAQNATEGGEPAAIQKRQIWIPVTCAVLALVIIFTAVLLLVIKPGRNSIYPRAVITLDVPADGGKRVTRTLTLTIWEDECPIAGTNFMFLVKIGFFNNNLVYDVHPGRNELDNLGSGYMGTDYMRFGAYTDYNSSTSKYNDAGFVDGISRKIFNVVDMDSGYKNDNNGNNKQVANKFGYRLHTDTGTGRARYKEKYVVSFNSNDSGDFVINMGENNDAFYGSSNASISSNLSAFGSFEDEESRKVLDDLMSSAYAKRGNTGIGDNVIGFSDKVRIKEIKLENMDDDKWDDFEFISYMLKANNGSSAFRAWIAK